MRLPLIIGALCAILTALPQISVRAQNAPAAPSGIDLLRQANQLYAATNRNDALPPLLPESEDLELLRLSVAQNAPALAKLRAALRAGIVMPSSFDADATIVDLYQGVGVFGRLLNRESALRAAQGDVRGAAQSSLDALELATQVGRGGYVNSLNGQSLARGARVSLEKVALRLDAAQSREVAARWETLSAQMPLYAQTLRAEENEILRVASPGFAALDDPKQRAQIQVALEDGTFSPDEAALVREQLGYSAATSEAAVRRAFAALIANAVPYQAARRNQPLEGMGAYVRLFVESANEPTARFSVERDILNNRLLVAALRLRATKLENGAYPITFYGQAQIDPFSPTLAPLIYRRDGDKYLLYSVGPDGIDEGGAETQRLMTDSRTGIKSVNGQLAPESTGDVIAPVF